MFYKNVKSIVSSEASSQQTPIYKVLVHSESLQVGHGAQPSFQMMSSLSAAKFPSYLSRPAKLPSVSEMAEKKTSRSKISSANNNDNHSDNVVDDDDSDSDEEVEIIEIKNKYSTKNVI